MTLAVRGAFLYVYVDCYYEARDDLFAWPSFGLT